MAGSQAGKVRQMFEPERGDHARRGTRQPAGSERLRALVGRLLAADGVQAERLREAGVTAPDGSPWPICRGSP